MAIELKKRGEKIVLTKDERKSLGQITVNLNWNQKIQQASKGFFAKLLGGGNNSIDLDLGCLYELKDGTKGAVQALGNAFGSLNNKPYIQLDGDDRTGANSEGENLRINGDKVAEIKRILVYAFIYEGVPNWAQADGVVTLKRSNGEDIVVKMDEHDNGKIMCAIALLTNQNDETFSFERVVKYYNGHEAMDRDFNWGMKWKAGKK